jgi:hypothetical protein
MIGFSKESLYISFYFTVNSISWLTNLASNQIRLRQTAGNFRVVFFFTSTSHASFFMHLTALAGLLQGFCMPVSENRMGKIPLNNRESYFLA